MTAGATIHSTIGKVKFVPAKYEIGQKVIVTPVDKQSLSTRDSDLLQFEGLNGVIANYYWMRPTTGEDFCLCIDRIGISYKEIVLYEDEIEPM